MKMKDFPLLFEPCMCALSPDAQTFVEMEGEPTEENVAAFNQSRIDFLTEWHCHAPISGVSRDVFAYKNGDYTGYGLVYRPSGCEGETLPAVVFYHGGGWVTLCKECYEYECAAIALQARCVVFSIDYRCAPRYLFPTPLEDCYAALEAVVEQAIAYGADFNRLALAGDSAGGNLALAVAILARRRRGPHISYMALAYPGVGVDTETDNELLSACIRYTGSQKLMDNPLVSPIMDDEPGRMPPMLIVVGTCDFLLDQNLRYARLVLENKGQVELALYQGMPHGFIQMTNEQGTDSIRFIAEKLRTHL